MAVLTAITKDDALALVAAYGLGEVGELQGLAAGSVNSNFSLEVGGRRLFLRLYEEQAVAGAEREAALLERLARAGVPTPSPLTRLDGKLVSTVRGKPAALFPWRNGTMRCQASVTPAHTRIVGEALARVHVAAGAPSHDPGRFGFEPLLGRIETIAQSRDATFAALAPSLRDALERVHAARDRSLPSGVVHGDLFRDNVLWQDDADRDSREADHDERPPALAALLDFESACDGTYAFDLMVTVLAWCVGDRLDASLARAMVAGYQSVRPLSEAERAALVTEGMFAALRFTITRITDFALRADVAGPRSVKDWRRCWMRFETLRDLGAGGLHRLLGV